MYNVMGTVVYLSMSADATCRGLRTPRDGPLVMELTEGIILSVLMLIQFNSMQIIYFAELRW